MFEKEAKNYAKKCEKEFHTSYGACLHSFQDGAEFGYNKANEWHYMEDVKCYEDLPSPPEEKDRIFIWKVYVFNEKGIKQPVCYHCGSFDDLCYEVNAYHVIAWKEIVLPKDSE